MLNFKSLEGKNIFNTTEPIPLNFSDDPVMFEKLSEALLFDLETSVDYEEAMNVIKAYESKLGAETVELMLLLKRRETQNKEIGVYFGFACWYKK